MFTNDQLKEGLEEFQKLYAKRPVKNNFGGGHSPHYYYVWWLCNHLKPKYIIESGVWYGQSTWLFDQMAFVDEIVSIDIDLSRIKYESKKRHVLSAMDFKNHGWNGWPVDETLIFFDDHVDHNARVRQAREFGFKHIIFDDNYPAGSHPRLDKERNNLQTLKMQDDYLGNGKNFEFDYFEFPPIYGDRVTRWGDFWEYRTKKPLLEDVKPETEVYWQERKEYTWICYCEL